MSPALPGRLKIRLVQISFLERLNWTALGAFTRTIGSEAGYLTGSTVQSRRDGLNVAQDVSPGYTLTKIKQSRRDG